jgi:hypothetical protein
MVAVVVWVVFGICICIFAIPHLFLYIGFKIACAVPVRGIDTRFGQFTTKPVS